MPPNPTLVSTADWPSGDFATACEVARRPDGSVDLEHHLLLAQRHRADQVLIVLEEVAMAVQSLARRLRRFGVLLKTFSPRLPSDGGRSSVTSPPVGPTRPLAARSLTDQRLNQDTLSC